MEDHSPGLVENGGGTKGGAVVWEPAVVALAPLALELSVDAALFPESALGAWSLLASVAEPASVGRTPLRMSESALLGIRDTASEGMSVNCDCTVVPATTARPIKVYLIVKKSCRRFGISCRFDQNKEYCGNRQRYGK
jgi:hypothetical protein